MRPPSFKKMLPHGLIGGSESFKIRSGNIRTVLFWSTLLILIGTVASSIWIASNADACDFEQASVGAECRITKDAFGTAQIVNIVFIVVSCLLFLLLLRNLRRVSGTVVQIGAIPHNEKNSLLIVGTTLLTFVLAAANLVIGYFFLYKNNDQSLLNHACEANTGLNGSSILAWTLALIALKLGFIALLGIGGYAPTDASPSAPSAESVDRMA